MTLARLLPPPLGTPRPGLTCALLCRAPKMALSQGKDFWQLRHDCNIPMTTEDMCAALLLPFPLLPPHGSAKA